MSVIVIGVDPGKSTGIAAIRSGRLELVQQVPPDRVAGVIIEYLAYVDSTSIEQDTIIAYERFVTGPLTGARSAQPDALHLVGMLQLIAERFRCRLVSYGPDVTKRFASNALLKRLGMYVHPADVGRADANDANDAVRLALVALASKHARLYHSLLESHPAGT